jgi:hypothetical protein
VSIIVYVYIGSVYYVYVYRVCIAWGMKLSQCLLCVCIYVENCFCFARVWFDCDLAEIIE